MSIYETESVFVKSLCKALKAEMDGHCFYSMAAQNTSDEKGKEIFLKLAEEELDHKRFLTAQYRLILERGRPDCSLSLGNQQKFSHAHPIFSPGIIEHIHDAHYEMSSLAIAIQLERAAVEFYQNVAQQAASFFDGKLKSFFDHLIEWETGHLDALLEQEKILEDAYWDSIIIISPASDIELEDDLQLETITLDHYHNPR